MEVSGQHLTLPFYPKERNSTLIEQEAGWTPKQVWTIWIREKFLAPAGIRNPVPPAGSLVFPRMKDDLIRCIGRTITNRGIKLKWSERKVSECNFVCHESHRHPWKDSDALGNESSGHWRRVPPPLGNWRSLVTIREVTSITHNSNREYCLLLEECKPFRKKPQKL